MNREKFMAELESLLLDIPASDRMDAIDYYNSYFDEAGKENEERILGELKSPLKVAKSIKASIGDDRESAAFTEEDFSDSQRKRQLPGNISEGSKGGVNISPILLAVLAVCSFPIWGSLLATVFSLLVGAAATIFAILVSIFAVTISFLLVGVSMVAVSFFRLFTYYSFANALVGIGLGCILTGVGIIFGLFLIWILRKPMPKLLKWSLYQGREAFYRIRAYLKECLKDGKRGMKEERQMDDFYERKP